MDINRLVSFVPCLQRSCALDDTDIFPGEVFQDYSPQISRHQHRHFVPQAHMRERAVIVVHQY